MDVFVDAEDRHLYLELLREYSQRHQLLVWDYALMTNHTHLIVVPCRESSLSTALRDTHGAYATMFNRKYGCTGHLWQARFYSCVLDEGHLSHAVRYVERNPVRAGIVTYAEEYAWSGAAPHVRGERDRYLADGLPLLNTVPDWSAWLDEGDHDLAVSAIRTATAAGQACGSDDFLHQLESHVGRFLKPQKRGRKPNRQGSANREDPYY